MDISLSGQVDQMCERSKTVCNFIRLSLIYYSNCTYSIIDRTKMLEYEYSDKQSFLASNVSLQLGNSITILSHYNYGNTWDLFSRQLRHSLIRQRWCEHRFWVDLFDTYITYYQFSQYIFCTITYNQYSCHYLQLSGAEQFVNLLSSPLLHSHSCCHC